MGPGLGSCKVLVCIMWVLGYAAVWLVYSMCNSCNSLIVYHVGPRLGSCIVSFLYHVGPRLGSCIVLVCIMRVLGSAPV